MTDQDEVLTFLRRAKARVEGDSLDPHPDSEAIRYTRDRLEEALPYAHAGADLPADARLKPVKQVVLGLSRPVTSNQAPFNHAILQALDGAAEAVEGLARKVDLGDQHANRVQAALATVELTVDDLVDEGRSVRRQLADVAESVTALRAEVAAARSDLASVAARQEMIFRTAREALAADGLDTGQLTELSRELSTDFEQLCEDLEDTFRGSREDVQAKLQPYVEDVAATDVEGVVIDIGCGRGEWLEVLAEAGIDAYGVDVNTVVVERCTARGLDVRQGDALVHLREIPAGRLGPSPASTSPSTSRSTRSSAWSMLRWSHWPPAASSSSRRPTPRT
jgi:hypothetical protein